MNADFMQCEYEFNVCIELEKDSRFQPNFCICWTAHEGPQKVILAKMFDYNNHDGFYHLSCKWAIDLACNLI